MSNGENFIHRIITSSKVSDGESQLCEELELSTQLIAQLHEVYNSDAEPIQVRILDDVGPFDKAKILTLCSISDGGLCISDEESQHCAMSIGQAKGVIKLLLTPARQAAIAAIYAEMQVDHLEELEKLAAIYTAPQEVQFRVGDKVIMREELRDTARPHPGETAIIVELNDPPLRDMSNPFTPSATRRLDITIAVYSSEVGLLTYLADSRRFTLAPDNAAR